MVSENSGNFFIIPVGGSRYIVTRGLKYPVFTQVGVYCNCWINWFFLLVKLFDTSVYRLAYPQRSSEWPYVFQSVVVCIVILSNIVSKQMKFYFSEQLYGDGNDLTRDRATFCIYS